MDLQKVLPRMVLLLLFLYLLLLGGHSHPLRSPSQSPEQFKMQKLLELIREKSEEMAQRQLSKNQGLTKEHPKRVLRSQDSTLRVPQRRQNSKQTHISSCFGHKIDRIGSVSRLGCNGLNL
ncbi:natriuretic peptides B isoform X2 [Mastomys coucha]|uniref:natriuretic peptides B isoform X2 n=1 Tax=Mastomys coucha TaxID=35658 RepID=UPI0012626895|nr:natriuretic peptides B isoform X2 [Mastomys coucha]